MVVFCRHFGRIVLELVAPCVAHVYIYRVAISVQFPYGGHLQVVPAFVIETGFPKIGRAGVGIFHPVEFPCTVQCHVVCRLFFHSFSGCVCIFKSEVVSVHWCAVHGIDFRIAPFLEGLCACREGKDCEQACHKLFFHAIINWFCANIVKIMFGNRL